MFDANISRFFPFFLVREYKNYCNYSCDFSCEPRPFFSVAYILQGSAHIRCAGHDFFIGENELLFVPKGGLYQSDWTASPTVDMISIHFDFDIQNNPFLTKETTVQKIAPFEQGDELSQFAFLLENYHHTEKSYTVFSTFLQICDFSFHRLSYIQRNAEAEAIQPALDYLAEHFSEPVRIEDLAKLCYKSPPRFYSAFKQITGTSPIVYKNRILITRCAQALLQYKNKSIEDISSEYGFCSSVYFRRLFKQFTGKTPTSYRKSPWNV